MKVRDDEIVFNPILEIIYARGYEIGKKCFINSDVFHLEAKKDNKVIVGSNPIALLALIELIEVKGAEWNIVEGKRDYLDEILEETYGDD